MKINGVEVELVPLDFSTMAQLDRMGINLNNSAERPVAFLVGLLAISMKCSFEEAAEHIRDHINAGGNVDELLDKTNAIVNRAIKKGIF